MLLIYIRLFDEIIKFEVGIFGFGEFFHPILNVRLFDEIINSKLGIFVFGDFFPLYGLGLSLSHKVGIFSIFGRNFFPTLWQTTVYAYRWVLLIHGLLIVVRKCIYYT